MKFLVTIWLGVLGGTCLGASYDPLKTNEEVNSHLVEFSYGKRKVPLKIYLPETKESAPLILLSHGMGGSREVGSFLGEHWAGRGFVVVAMQHGGSDELIWKDVPMRQRKSKMEEAANGGTFRLRMSDVPATIDQLEKWQREEGHFLAGRLDLEKIGMAGHSYGAVTTQAVAGVVYGARGKLYHDERIDAALALSPSPPRLGSPERAFGELTMPLMLMTGTKDGSPIGDTTPETRRKVFPALPAGDKFELVLKDAEHHAFSDHRSRSLERNPNHHRVIQALSSAFWDCYLGEDEGAKGWLEGEAVEELLEEGDLWQKK